MILHTTASESRQLIEKKLQNANIDYIIYDISLSKINIFFGKPECVEIVRRINKPRLNDYTNEEDFILGTMLGYDMLEQCDRYLRRVDSTGQKAAV